MPINYEAGKPSRYSHLFSFPERTGPLHEIQKNISLPSLRDRLALVAAVTVADGISEYVDSLLIFLLNEGAVTRARLVDVLRRPDTGLHASSVDTLLEAARPLNKRIRTVVNPVNAYVKVPKLPIQAGVLDESAHELISLVKQFDAAVEDVVASDFGTVELSENSLRSDKRQGAPPMIDYSTRVSQSGGWFIRAIMRPPVESSRKGYNDRGRGRKERLTGYEVTAKTQLWLQAGKVVTPTDMAEATGFTYTGVKKILDSYCPKLPHVKLARVKNLVTGARRWGWCDVRYVKEVWEDYVLLGIEEKIEP